MEARCTKLVTAAALAGTFVFLPILAVGQTSTSSGTNQTAASGTSGSNTGSVNASSTNVSLSGDTQQMLDGLVNVNVGQVTAVANVQDVLNNSQLQLMVQALNTNPTASQNAT